MFMTRDLCFSIGPILSAVCSKPNVEDYTVLVENQTEDFLDSYMKSYAFSCSDGFIAVDSQAKILC